jgi:hypothetical protein
VDTGTLVQIAVVVARLAVPLAIPRFPLPGILASFLADAIDGTALELAFGKRPPGYEPYDKGLDVYYLTIAYLSTIRNWPQGVAFNIGRFLLYYRLVGVLLFEYTQADWLLFIFPNTFEYFFITIEGYKLAHNPFKVSRGRVIAVAAAIWIFIKLPQEWWIHIAELDVTEVVQRYPFVALVALVVGGIALAGIGWRALRLLPPAEWPPTASAEEQARHLGLKRALNRGAPAASLDWRFIEKVVLVTLVAGIFGRILPGASENLMVGAIDAVVVIALSTVTSEALRHLGVSWRAGVLQFVAISIASAVGVAAVEIVLRTNRPDPPVVTVLFLIGLLTLIVVLFDRFDALRQRRTGETVTSPGGGAA